MWPSCLLKSSQWFRISQGKDQIQDLALSLTTPERLKYIERFGAEKANKHSRSEIYVSKEPWCIYWNIGLMKSDRQCTSSLQRIILPWKLWTCSKKACGPQRIEIILCPPLSYGKGVGWKTASSKEVEVCMFQNIVKDASSHLKLLACNYFTWEIG